MSKIPHVVPRGATFFLVIDKSITNWLDSDNIIIIINIIILIPTRDGVRDFNF